MISTILDVLLFLVLTLTCCLSNDNGVAHVVEDLTKTNDFSDLVWPDGVGGWRTAPWNANPTIFDNLIVWKSVQVTKILDERYKSSSPISSYNNFTYMEIFNLFFDNNCPLLVHGGEIRDAILGLTPYDTDVQVSCSADKIRQICNQFSFLNCQIYQDIDGNSKYTAYHIKIGDMDGYIKMEAHFGGDYVFSFNEFAINQEYRCNSVLYDAINKVIYDPTGEGVNDIVNKEINIATKELNFDSFKSWASAQTSVNLNSGTNASTIIIDANGGMSLFRFWKLRIPPKSFHASQKLIDFIKIEINNAFADNNGAISSLKLSFEYFWKHLKSDEQRTAILQYMIIDLGQQFVDLYFTKVIDEINNSQAKTKTNQVMIIVLYQ